MESTEVDDCFTEDIMPDLYSGLVFPQKRKELLMAQNRFTHFKGHFYTSHQSFFIFNELYLGVTTFNYLNCP